MNLTSLLLSGLLLAGQLAAQTLAFPGAMGFGANATGGRGGNVYHVTNLNDSGAGSFRDAVSVAGRTVVFDVGGYITLSTECAVKSNITIAGQTAPGMGIAIRGAEVTFGNQQNVICRFMRFRPGGDSGSTQNGLSLYQAKNIILDHCSVAFAKWNNIDAVSEDWQNKPVNNISVQHCLIANPIGQQFGAHTECPEGTWFWYGNIFSSGHNRQPLAKIHTVFINNTIYNYSAGYTTHTSTRFKHDIVNNYFIGGPGSAGTDNTWFQVDKNQSIYYSGNYKDRDRDGLLGGAVTTPYWYQGPGTILTAPWSTVTPAIPTLTAAQAVVRNNCDAGALPRDAMDNLVLSQVKTLGLGATGRTAGTAGPDGGLYTSHNQTGLPDGGWGVITGGTAPVDSDRDGMPDDWEAAKSLNPANAADGKTLAASGYSNLEEYLNWLALPHAFVAKNTAAQPTSVTLDLRPWAEGMPAGAAFTVSGVTGGAVSQTGTGGYDVRFTPALNASGLGSFNFNVTSGGYTHTRQAGILISANAPPRNLRWKGDSTANVWNTSIQNWTNADTGAASVFSNGDRVTLDDAGSTAPALALSGSLSPGYMAKSGTQAYTLSGSGTLGGAMSLNVDGSGPLTLGGSAAHSYAGGTFLQDATLILSSAATPGSGALTFSGSSVLTSAYAAANLLNLSSNQIRTDAGDSATLNLSARTALGGGAGSGTVQVNARGTASGTSGNYFNGSWSGFTGVLNITGQVVNAQCDFNINGGGFTNLAGAELNLDAVKVQSRHNSGGNVIAIGSLNGTATATLGGSSFGGGCTYEIGARNESGVFSGAITNGISPTSVSKVGTGTFHLAGPHTYTGATNIAAGTFYADGTFPGLLNVAGGSLSPRSVATVTGQIQANGGLTLEDCTLSMDLSSLPSTSSDRVTCPAGTTLSLLGTELTFRIKFTDGWLAPGTYPLVDGSATLVRTSGIALSVTSPLPAGSRQTLAVERNSSTTPVPAYVNLVVTGRTADLVWAGSGGGAWDVTTTENWLNGEVMNDPSRFHPFDSVTFFDTAATHEVVLTGSLQPRYISMQHEFAYTFSGSGTIDGAAKLELLDRGILTITATGASTFTGGTTIWDGEILLDTASASPLGAGPVTVAGGAFANNRITGGILNLGTGRSLPNSVVAHENSTVRSLSGNVSLVSNPANTLSGTGPLSFVIPSGICTIQGAMSGFTGTLSMGASNGMLRLNGNTNANYGSAAAHFDLGTGNATLANRNGGVTVALGALSGGPNTTLQGRQSGSGATASNYLIGGRNEDATFHGRIVTGGDQNGVNITKQGTGTWTLCGSSSYTGDMTVQAGKLTISGSLTNAGDFSVLTSATLHLSGGSITTPSLEIAAGGTLSGCGVINGDVVCHGTITLDCPAGLTINGDVQNNGLMLVTARSRIISNGALENRGTIDLIGSPATALPASVTGDGTILDAGLVTIQSILMTGGPLAISMQTYPNHTYELQSAAALTGPWIAVTAGVTMQTSPAGLRTWTIPAPAAGRRFYRVAVGP